MAAMQPRQDFNLPDWCARTDVGLKITKPIKFEDWQEAFHRLDRTRAGHQWWIGDHLNEGERMYGEDYLQVIDPNEEAERAENNPSETYQTYMRVACRIPARRRLREVSWSHHQTVAYLESDEEQDYWLARVRDERISVHKLRKLIKGEPQAEVEPDPDLFVLQDPAVRAYLETDIQNQRKQFADVPENAPFLRDQLVSRIEASQWQLSRTVESDCDIVREAVCELLGTWQQVFNWLKIRNRIISPPDVRAYLGTLVAEGRVIEEKDEKPNPLAKGTTSTVYKPKRNPTDDKKDEERRAKQALV